MSRFTKVLIFVLVFVVGLALGGLGLWYLYTNQNVGADTTTTTPITSNPAVQSLATTSAAGIMNLIKTNPQAAQIASGEVKLESVPDLLKGIKNYVKGNINSLYSFLELTGYKKGSTCRPLFVAARIRLQVVTKNGIDYYVLITQYRAVGLKPVCNASRTKCVRERVGLLDFYSVDVFDDQFVIRTGTGIGNEVINDFENDIFDIYTPDEDLYKNLENDPASELVGEGKSCPVSCCPRITNSTRN